MCQEVIKSFQLVAAFDSQVSEERELPSAASKVKVSGHPDSNRYQTWTVTDLELLQHWKAPLLQVNGCHIITRQMQDGEGTAIQFEFSYGQRQQKMCDVWTIVHLQFFKGVGCRNCSIRTDFTFLQCAISIFLMAGT